MKLIIAEKPELGRDIARAVCGAKGEVRLPYTGGGYMVVNCIGHLLEWAEPAKLDPDAYGDRRDVSALPILLEPWPQVPDPDKTRALENIKRGLDARGRAARRCRSAACRRRRSGLSCAATRRSWTIRRPSTISGGRGSPWTGASFRSSSSPQKRCSTRTRRSASIGTRSCGPWTSCPHAASWRLSSRTRAGRRPCPTTSPTSRPT